MDSGIVHECHIRRVRLIHVVVYPLHGRLEHDAEKACPGRVREAIRDGYRLSENIMLQQ
jgi:hypothetical protein